MNQFQGNVHYQRQVVSDRHQQIRREFGASRTRRVPVFQRGRTRSGPSR